MLQPFPDLIVAATREGVDDESLERAREICADLHHPEFIELQLKTEANREKSLLREGDEGGFADALSDEYLQRTLNLLHAGKKVHMDRGFFVGQEVGDTEKILRIHT